MFETDLFILTKLNDREKNAYTRKFQRDELFFAFTVDFCSSPSENLFYFIKGYSK